MAAQSFGYFRRVDRNSHKGRAGGADFFIMIAEVRQLAEAKGSPRPAIENEHNGATGYEGRQSSRDGRRVQELELPYTFSHHWKFAHRHSHILIHFLSG